MKNKTSNLLLLLLIAPLLALAAALVTQYGFNMAPCGWCVLQRLIFVLIAVLAGLGLLMRAQWWRAGTGALILLLAGSGIASALYQHFVAARSNSCRLSLAENILNYLHLDSYLASVFAIRATCADAAVALLGIPYAFWSLAVFAVIAVVATLLVFRGRGRP